ncbi:MAG TPA: xylose isomerase [Prolixibacteraceae bacterium]|nr:xylose isomerase [Prolixibacteraceae bacterium]HCU59777.1 xylose isomerase [Prolixibacteraceae bacterium]
MNKHFSRRNFLQTAAISTTAAILPGCAGVANGHNKDKTLLVNQNPLKIGIMTYTLAKDWSIETIIKNCTETGYQSVELRTTHAHGIELTLSASERATVKKRFEDSPLETISLASAYCYHFPDQAELKKNIEGTKEYVLLAKDVGAKAIRVFPNTIPKDVPEEKTFEQIGKSLAEVSQFGHDHGVEIRVCVHGVGTDSPGVMKKIIDYSQNPYVYINWNCNPADTQGGGFEYNFNLLKDRIRGVHMHELWTPEYPFRLLFKKLSDMNYKGYCLAEVDKSEDPIRFMKYYRALFLAYQNAI